MVDHLHSLMQTEVRLPRIFSARVSNLMAAFGADPLDQLSRRNTTSGSPRSASRSRLGGNQARAGSAFRAKPWAMAWD